MKNKLLKEFISYILEAKKIPANKPSADKSRTPKPSNRPKTPQEQAKEAGYTAIATTGYWSKSGEPPAEASTRGNKFRILTPQEQEKANKELSGDTSTPSDFGPDVVQVKGPERYRQTEPKPITPSDIDPSVGKKKQRAPRKKKEKIEPIETSVESVRSSFGNTELDVDGLIKAIQGVTSEEKGEKGAGTPESTAAEAATTLCIQRVIELRKQNPNMPLKDFLKLVDAEMVKLLSELRGMPDSILDSDWAITARNHVIGVIHTVETVYGTRIDEIAWDNAAGRSAMGLPAKKHPKDRSDIYIRTADGRILGISLKKNGKVFLANDGLKKALTKIAEKAPERVKKKITEISSRHKTSVKEGFLKLSTLATENKRAVRSALGKLSRDDIEDVESPKYDEFFTPEGYLTDEAIDTMVSGRPGAQTAVGGTLFIKAMSAISEDVPGIRAGLLDMRAADSTACQSFLTLVNDDEEVREVVTDFLIDGLDLVQLVTPNPPFGPDGGVDGFFIAYGEADLKEDGSRHPMVVTRQTVLDTLGLPSDISDEKFEVAVREAMIIDSEESGKMGFIRLRSKNPDPPPGYFYPAISQLTVRAKGLGKSANLLMEQGTGWTYSLLNGTSNPEEWPVHQQLDHAGDNIRFLLRQLDNPLLTNEQRNNINQEIEEFRTMEREIQGR